MKQPVTVLIVLDGWGVAPANRGNAISLAATPVFDKLIATYPTMVLQASGESVGLPWGEMGNSEVGHMNMGAGTIVYQDLPRITKAITDGSFATRPAFQHAREHAEKSGGTIHLAGLVSNGGIHSFNEHLYALLETLSATKCTVAVHAFLDGRDTPYNSAKNFIVKLEKEMRRTGVGTIATLAGRFWAMDRDRRWERTELAYDTMVLGKGMKTATDATKAIEESYARKVYDEEFEPTVILGATGEPRATVKDGDAVIFFNFRNDRMRQLTRALVLPEFADFSRKRVVERLFVATMTEYEEGLPVEIAFPKEHIHHPLGRVVSEAGLKQLRIAETEKYPHVTFFFNGGREEPFPNEERVLIPSPHVATYDVKPQMGAHGITDRVVASIEAGTHDFILLNFANADMVGHTGNLPAIIKAVEILDACIGRIVDAALAKQGTVIITADHGNAEEAMELQTGVINKEHSTSPVPFIVVGKQWEGRGLAGGRDLSSLTPVGFLSDVAPTVLALMGLSKPPSMTGRTLINPKQP